MKVCYDWCMVRKYWNKAKVIFMAWTSPVVSRVILRSGRTIEYLFGVFEGAMEKTSVFKFQPCQLSFQQEFNP